MVLLDICNGVLVNWLSRKTNLKLKKLWFIVFVNLYGIGIPMADFTLPVSCH